MDYFTTTGHEPRRSKDEPTMLVIKLEIPQGDESWVVAIQRTQMELRSGVERQVIVKRTSREDIMCIPPAGGDNFVISVEEEYYHKS